MRKEVVLVSAYDGVDHARLIGRLLSAEDWRVSHKVGRGALDDVADFDPEALLLVVLTTDAAFSPYVMPWTQAARPDRMAILNFGSAVEAAFGETTQFDFRDWRGDRAQLWRSMLRWLEAPHARLDTRVWLKRA